MPKRIDEIRQLLFERKKVLVSDLSQYYKVSTVSIRKDLAELEQEGTATRIYGGAMLAQNAQEPLTTPSSFFEDPQRAALANRACEEICDGDSIFLGSGRTCCLLAKLLKQFKNLSIVTNNITALDDLLQSGARVYLIGGEVTSTDGHTLFSSPENPQTFMDNVFVTKAFTSISGIDLRAGLTVNSIISTYIYRNIPAIAREWYLMADFNKFDQISIYPVAGLEQLHCLITNGYPQSYERCFMENNLRICHTK